MKKLALVVAFALCVLPAFAAEDFTGKWSGSFSGTGSQRLADDRERVPESHPQGQRVDGHRRSGSRAAVKILNGKVNENSVAFEVQGGGDTQGGPLPKFALTFADGHLKGDVNAERGGEKMTAKVDLTRVK